MVLPIRLRRIALTQSWRKQENEEIQHLKTANIFFRLCGFNHSWSNCRSLNHLMTTLVNKRVWIQI
jgi:hypothetical protein